MTIAETLAALKAKKGIEPSADYTGPENTDDFIFAICRPADTKDKLSTWTVCADHVKEHSGSLNATTSDTTYIRTGTTTVKGETQRTLSINGDRCVGDAFQDFLLSHRIKYGSGQSVVVPYVYFSVRTGKGEKGEAALIVTSDVGGSASAAATFAADVKGIGTPDELDYLTAVAAETQSAQTGKAVKA